MVKYLIVYKNMANQLLVNLPTLIIYQAYYPVHWNNWLGLIINILKTPEITIKLLNRYLSPLDVTDNICDYQHLTLISGTILFLVSSRYINFIVDDNFRINTTIGHDPSCVLIKWAYFGYLAKQKRLPISWKPCLCHCGPYWIWTCDSANSTQQANEKTHHQFHIAQKVLIDHGDRINSVDSGYLIQFYRK